MITDDYRGNSSPFETISHMGINKLTILPFPNVQILHIHLPYELHVYLQNAVKIFLKSTVTLQEAKLWHAQISFHIFGVYSCFSNPKTLEKIDSHMGILKGWNSPKRLST